MSAIYEKSKNGILLIKESFKTILQLKKVLLFIIIIMVTLNLALFGLFIDFEYQTYGIHLFDHTTLSALLDFDFFTHISHLFFIMGAIFIISFVTLFTKFVLFFLVIEQLEGKKASLITALMIPFKKIPELVRITALRSFGFIISLVNIIDVETHAKRLQELTAGNFDDEYSEYEKPSGIFLIPLIIEKDLHTITALEESEKMLQEKFSKNMQANYSLFMIEIYVWLATFLFVGGTLHLIFSHHPFTAIITCMVVIITTSSLLANVKVIFDAAVYTYCKGLPTGNFSQEIITRMFKSA